MGNATRLHQAVRPRRAAQARAVETTNSRPAAMAAGPSPLVPLQQSIGNRAVGRLVQAKLKVGRPGDRFEREADRVAERVLRTPPADHALAPARPPRIQRLCAECGDEELRRQPEDEEEEVVAAKAYPGEVPDVTPELDGRVRALGDGRPLPEPARAFFEDRFGRDLGGVRVHTDADAAATARRLRARAFTAGPDIVFGAGEYAPATTAGRSLLAHELVHVVQQGAAGQQGAPASPASVTGAPIVAPAARGSASVPHLQRRVEILDDPLPPGFVGPPSRTGAAFIESTLEDFTDLDLSFDGTFLAVDAATRAAVLRERRERPTAAEVRAAPFFGIPGVAREKSSAALKLAQIILDTRATARIQPVFGEAPVLMGAFPAAGGGGTQRIDIDDLRAWQTLTEPANEPALRVIAFLRGLLGRAAAPRPATPVGTHTAGSIVYHEIVESFRAALAGAGTPFPGPHREAITTANVALRAMRNLEFMQCPSTLTATASGELQIRTLWRRRRGAGREDRFAQDWFLSAPPDQALVWVDPPVLIAAGVPTGNPCPP